MLAAGDRANQPELREFAEFSVGLYPEFLARIGELGGQRVGFQTEYVVEEVPGGRDAVEGGRMAAGLATAGADWEVRREWSVDPRQLGAGVVAAVRGTAIDLKEGVQVERVRAGRDGVRVETSGGVVEAGYFVDCMGAWSPARVRPVKGQMLAVRVPSGVEMGVVVRTDSVYMVPRTSGPDAGRVVIGATVEDVGFDWEVRGVDIVGLHGRAARFLPWVREAEFVEAWAGVRPGTADGLPVIGVAPGRERYVVASGHYRNGILLAPGTGVVVGRLLAGEDVGVDLGRFGVGRFG
jgi:glycine oxidase